MGTPLNIRDIGESRKKALENEAALRGTSLADVVRDFIDAGVARSEAERAQAEWIASAKSGLSDEARHLAQHGSTLARFRRGT